MSETFLMEPGFQFSAALDPHRRAAYRKALESAFDAHAGRASVALLGWQSATLIDVVAGRSDRVVIIEKDAELVESMHKGIVARGFGKNVTILQEDPAEARLDEKVDIVVASAATTWFIEGPGAAIMANARAHICKSDGAMIPRRCLHLFELASAPTDINGIAVRVPRYGRPGEPFPVLSESKHFITNDFTEASDLKTEIEDSVFVKPLLSGTLTGIKLTTLLEFSESLVHLAGHSGYQSIMMPLREDLEVEAGVPVTIFVRYTMGEGLKRTRFMAKKVREHDRGHEISEEIIERFKGRVADMVDSIDELGRASDLDRVVSYTIDPHGDVSRLTALFWTIDEEFRKPVRQLVESFKREAGQEGTTPGDELIYDLMVEVYRQKRR